MQKQTHEASIPCALGKLIPEVIDVETLKADGWNDHRILVVGADDTRINWMERQVIEQMGERLFGRRKNA